MIRSQWDEWLAVLDSEGKLAPKSSIPFAMRGYGWGMQIALVGDFSGYTLVGRVKIAPDAPTDLAVMTAFGPVPFEGTTLWELSLPGSGQNSTANLPVNTNGDAVDKFLFLLVLVPPGGEPYPLLGGELTLMGAL